MILNAPSNAVLRFHLLGKLSALFRSIIAAMMGAKLRKILLLIICLNKQAFSQLLEYSQLLKQAMPMDQCEFIVVSSSVISLDFGRGAIKFQGLQNLFHVQDGDKLTSLTTRMSCLILTMTEMSSELELLKLIDMMREFKIRHKYLFVTMGTFNNTLFHETNINFNVMINHQGVGMLYESTLLKKMPENNMCPFD